MAQEVGKAEEMRVVMGEVAVVAGVGQSILKN